MAKEENESQDIMKVPIKANGGHHIRDLLEENGYIDYATSGGVQNHITLGLLTKLTTIPSGKRAPNDAELLMFGNMCVEQKANPYLKECWLVFMKGCYQPIVAAQMRLRKAQAQKDYNGYEWGYITNDGTRHPPGRESRVLPVEVTGIWGQVSRKNIDSSFYHETFMSEYKRSTWDDKPITMILKVNRDQVHKFAYADQMGNLCTENEINTIPSPDYDTTTPRREDRKPVVNETDQMAEIVDLFNLYSEAVKGANLEAFGLFCVTTCGGEMTDYTKISGDKIVLVKDGFAVERIVDLKRAIDEIATKAAEMTEDADG